MKLLLDILGFLIISLVPLFFKIQIFLMKPSVCCLQFFCKDQTPFDIFLEQSLAFRSIDYTNCELCHFPVRNEVNDSSHEDLIIAAAVNHITNENFFSRTIRTTGSKCHIVIVCDEEAMNKLPKERYESAVSCGVQFCVVPSKRWGGGYWGKATIAYYYVLAYILRNRGVFKRIIFQDLFDSIFQGDPFTSDLISSPNEIHVTSEYTSLQSQFMMQSIKEANLTISEWFLKKHFANSSHFGGLAETILTFLLIYVSVNDFAHSWNDQITANYIEYIGALRAYGLYYSDETKLQRFINFWARRPITGDSIGYVKAFNGNDNNYAICLHHIYKRNNIMLNLAEVCPIKERNKTLVNDYFGKCNERCISDIMNYYNKLDHKNNMST